LLIQAVTLRDFRGYERAGAPVGSGLTVITGPNGAGKTNLLEALYFGCTGRSCRTNNDRELVRFGAGATRVTVDTAGSDGRHELTVGFVPGEPKRMAVDGAPVERLLDSEHRPLVSVFLPDRLELVKGVPAGRRAHLDQFVTALWPARALTRRTYAQSLAQRNALLTRIRNGYAGRDSLGTWDEQLATHALALMADRRVAVEAVAPVFSDIAEQLGLDGEPTVSYRPRSGATTPAGFTAELAERLDGDLERGHTGHGPHRDDLILKRHGRELKTYGSQGQQRLGLLALLLAERQVIAERRDSAPVMLLDDVMSELDARRRQALVELLHNTEGQAVITATDLDHIPGADGPETTRIAVAAGQLHIEPATAAHL
jgi:DNA replication and repair protein RecF